MSSDIGPQKQPATLRQIVAKMRHAQKEYFRTRSVNTLQESKRLERCVDKWLADDGQKSLFEDPTEEPGDPIGDREL